MSWDARYWVTDRQSTWQIYVNYVGNTECTLQLKIPMDLTCLAPPRSVDFNSASIATLLDLINANTDFAFLVRHPTLFAESVLELSVLCLTFQLWIECAHRSAHTRTRNFGARSSSMVRQSNAPHWQAGIPQNCVTIGLGLSLQASGTIRLLYPCIPPLPCRPLPRPKAAAPLLAYRAGARCSLHYWCSGNCAVLPPEGPPRQRRRRSVEVPPSAVLRLKYNTSG